MFFYYKVCGIKHRGRRRGCSGGVWVVPDIYLVFLFGFSHYYMTLSFFIIFSFAVALTQSKLATD